MKAIILAMMVSVGLIGSLFSQSLKSQEEKDWDYFVGNKSKLCLTIEECDALHELNLLDYTKFIDDVYTKRSQMAERFLDKYPNSEHYGEVLDHYLYIYFLPKFISKKIEGERLEHLTQFSGPVRFGPEVSSFYRVLPIDTYAMERWINKGDSLVAKVLKSNASKERQADVELRLLSRDYNLAMRWYDALPKMPMEDDYWIHFDKQYWHSFKIRLYALLDKYPDYRPLARYIQSLLLNSLAVRSPELAKFYRNQFLIKTGEGSPFADRDGVKALHDMLNVQTKAEESLKETKTTEPLKMAFTAMDGTKIDLADMRGKVVLIDFWSTWCAPCIREMPHVQKLYDKYRSSGFEVIGIVAGGEKVKDKVFEIIEKKDATWPQYLDGTENKGLSYHSLFNIKLLPTVWLLDKEGRVVDKNARGEGLEPLIKKYLEL